LAAVPIISLQANTRYVHTAGAQNAYPSNQLVYSNKITHFLSLLSQKYTVYQVTGHSTFLTLALKKWQALQTHSQLFNVGYT